MDGVNKFDGWEKVTNLGSGGFGIVDLWKKGEEEIALKQIRVSGDISVKLKERWQKEIEIMKRLKHINVITAKEIPPPLEILSQNLPILAMEYCSKGDLRKVISKTCKGLKESEVLHFSRDISSAVEYLHSQRIVHRDLKPENIVLKEVNNKIIYKLIDLGYAKDLDQDSICNSFVGTLQYLAPELYQQQDYTHTVDYWSLGTVIFEIITGFRPFLPNMSPVQWFEFIKKKKDEDISVYQENGKTIFSNELPIHIRLCEPLKQAFQKWLKTMLTWDPSIRGYDHKERGKKQKCFIDLEKILEMKILSFYHVMENTMLHYPLAQHQTFENVQSLIFDETKIPIEEQEILLIDGKQPMSHVLAEDILHQNCIGGETYPLFLFRKMNILENQNRATHFRALPPKVHCMLENEPYTYPIKAIWEEAVYHCERILFDCDNLMNCHKACWSAKMKTQREFFKAYDNLNCCIQSLSAKVEFFLISLRHNMKKYQEQAEGGISSISLINSWHDKEQEAVSIQELIQTCKTTLEAKNIDTKKVCSLLVIKKYDNLKREVNSAKELYIKKEYSEKDQKIMKRIFLTCIEDQKDISNEIHNQLIQHRQTHLKLLHDLNETKLQIANFQKYNSTLTTLQKNLQVSIWKLIEVLIKQSSANSRPSSNSSDNQCLSSNSFESMQVLQDNSKIKNDMQRVVENFQSMVDTL